MKQKKEEIWTPIVTAGQIMHAPLITLNSGDTVRKAASLFIDKKISGAPVLNHLGEPIGVLTKTDVIRYEREFAATRLTDAVRRAMKAAGTLETVASGFHEETEEDYVDRWMTPKVYAVLKTASLASVVKEMARRKIHRIFVEDQKTQKFVGVITTFDLLNFMARVFYVVPNGSSRKMAAAKR